MAGFFRYILPLLLVALTATGCATAMDMSDTNSQIAENTARIERLEKQQADQQKQAAGETRSRLDGMEDEISAMRRQFADSKISVDSLLEKLESMQAYLSEVEVFIAQFRKKGGEMDKALEGLTNKLEAEVRNLGEKVKEMLSEESDSP
jgi:chromosome segregation ATPase